MTILEQTAIFWDGIKQLPGALILEQTKLIFKFDDFKSSHLNLCISLEEIQYARIFLVFDIAKNGLKVCTHNGHTDLFILEDCKKISDALNQQIEKIRKKKKNKV